jgi:hypothetical protein
VVPEPEKEVTEMNKKVAEEIEKVLDEPGRRENARHGRETLQRDAEYVEKFLKERAEKERESATRRS